MIKLLAPLVLAGVLLLVLAALWPQSSDPYQRTIDLAAAQATAQAITADADRAQAQADALAPLWTLALALLVVGAVVFVLGLLAAGLYALWTRRHPLVWLPALDLPVPRAVLETGLGRELPYAVLEHRTQAAIAAGPQQPHTFSPHVVYNNRQDGAAPAQLVAPVAYTPPTFAEMRTAGLFGPGKPLIYGYNAGTEQPITGDWRLLQSGAIAGYSGEGKSNTAAFIAGQAYEQGNVKLLLCDPHAASGDDALSARLAPLADAFLLPPAQTDGEIVAALSTARDLVRQRLINGPPHPFKLLVIIDEFTYLMSRSTVADLAAELVEMIAQEGRKTDTACQVIGQVFTAARSGSSALRDSLQGVIVHRMKRAQARLLVDPESARLAETLTRGRALFSRGADVIPIAIPRCGVADLSRPAARATSVERAAHGIKHDNVMIDPVEQKDRGVLLTGDWWEALTGQRTAPDAWDATGRPDASPAESINLIDLETAGRQDASEPASTPNSVRAYALFCAGWEVSAICKELLGVDLGKGGRAGQQASRQVQEWIRQEIARRRANPPIGEAI